jgi:hypothetical protein
MLNPSRSSTLKLKVLLKLLVSSSANFLPSNQIKKSLLLLLNWTRLDQPTPSLLLCKSPPPSPLINSKTSSASSVKLKNHSNKLLKMLVNKKSKLNSTSKPSLLKLLPKENPFQLLDKTLKDNYLKTNKPSTSKRRERKMPPMNSTLLLLVKNKRKKTVISLEPPTLKNLNTDNKKFQSSDKLKKSLPPSSQVLRFTFKKDHPTDIVFFYFIRDV